MLPGQRGERRRQQNGENHDGRPHRRLDRPGRCRRRRRGHRRPGRDDRWRRGGFEVAGAGAGAAAFGSATGD
ncbi:hypothetical protein KCH_75260 [Kitasatospora cheerisanensis KCTC 2395]|uniref:Uncharacterized protein n=1 Tax=Kitasatospora cheerisanensis KCTC 2395 TaxID=1348663 RepID=A0A066YRP6_9ACTN|nr:hypothetical protein KCH_75260 [Kitasatospora cheerisanensis KCTC 2395]